MGKKAPKMLEMASKISIKAAKISQKTSKALEIASRSPEKVTKTKWAKMYLEPHLIGGPD